MRLLSAELKKAESKTSKYFHFSEYTDRDDIQNWNNKEAAIAATALVEKYGFQEMLNEKTALEAKIKKASEAIKTALEKFEKEEEQRRKNRVTALKLAIRDIWASESITEVKQIVAEFVKSA